MPIINILEAMENTTWAVRPEVFESWAELVRAKDAGDLLAANTRKQTQDADTDIPKGLAVVPITGSLVNRLGFFSCGTSYGSIKKAIQEALDDWSVKAILLDVDSPGGMVSGCEELVSFIYEARVKKPIYAHTSGQMCSAAMWIGSAAQEVACSRTAEVGSVGVLSVHTDRSEMNKNWGVTVTYLTAGKYKALLNDSQPLSDEARAYAQERLDAVYTVFVSDLARNRGVDQAKALTMADGKVFVGEAGRAVGLVDRISSRTEFITHIMEGLSMNKKELQAKHPDLLEAVEADARRGMVAETEVPAAVEQERKRLLGLAEAVFGQAAGEKFDAVVSAGVTPEQIKAITGIMPPAGQTSPPAESEAKPDKKAEILDALQAASPDPVQPAQTAGEPKPGDWKKLVDGYKAEHKVGVAEAQKAIEEQYPGLREKYLTAGK